MDVERTCARRSDHSPDSPLLIAVTILTSSSEEDLKAVGIESSTRDMVVKLATLSKHQGLDGVVCSARETSELKTVLGSEFVLVTPGIRLPTDEADDQKRIVSPVDAITQGSDYLVIGRPITQAGDPVQKLLTINSEISQL